MLRVERSNLSSSSSKDRLLHFIRKTFCEVKSKQSFLRNCREQTAALRSQNATGGLSIIQDLRSNAWGVDKEILIAEEDRELWR